ncbi:MAG: protein phosphatase 2C domain-containing protein [Ferruginibacter sp.]
MADYFFGITDIGRKRTNNEDCFIAENLAGGSQVLACVIDGVGGYEGGEQASAIARETILQGISNEITEPIDALKQALISANEKIFVEKSNNPEHNKMACVVTLVIADTGRNKFYYAHVGDTRLYLLRDNTLVKISSDHSAVGYLEESGRLTEEAAMRHPRRNEISKALGFQPSIDVQSDFIETSESPFLPGDTLILCSDGLTDMINNEAISAILNSAATLEEKGSRLIKAANDAGGNDNITVVIVQNNNKPQPLEATKPQQKKENHSAASIPPETKLDITSQAPKTNKNNLIVPLLIFLILGLGSFSGWLWYKKNNPLNSEVPGNKITSQKNEDERSFAVMVNDTTGSTNQIITPGSAKNIILSDAIHFTHDTVRLNLNHTLFIADSAYNGPAFIFSHQCRYISISKASFKNFTTGIQLNGQEIHLDSVSFPNTISGIQQNIILSDSIFSGRIPAVLFFRNDSIYTHK